LQFCLLDLDGTLIDTEELIRLALKYAAREALGVELTDAQVAERRGMPLVRALDSLDPTRREELWRHYNVFVFENHDRLARPFPGTVEVLEALKERGVRLALVTSKRQVTARLALDQFQLWPYFDYMVFGDSTEKNKPHPEPVYAALEGLGAAEPGKALMVGDTPYDIMAARAAGTRAGAALFDASVDEEALLALKPDYAFYRPADLLQVFPPEFAKYNVLKE